MGESQKIKYVNVDECSKFKLELEKKIVVNEKLIKELKNIPNSNSKFFKKVTSLEKDNIYLRSKIDKYEEEVKANWKKFQLEINQNVSDINSELQDMTLKNNK